MVHTYKFWVVLAAWLVLILVGVAVTGQVLASETVQANELKTIDRNLEPVIIRGSQVFFLNNTPIDDLFLYKFNGNSLAGQIPIQVDEVTASGSYTISEDNLLDANDEIAFMAVDLGDRPANTAVLTGTLPISATWYEIEVTDPLNTTKKGWVYLVRSHQLTPTFGNNDVAYDEVIQRINADQYNLGFATSYEGIEYLTINSSPTDILDRSKFRADLNIFGGGITTVTEQSLTNPTITLVKNGPVRVLLERTVQRSILSVSVNLRNTYLAYPALVNLTSRVNFSLGSFTLGNVRTSIDLSHVVSGTTTFYNAAAPLGVPVDGSFDTVPATPLSRWGQVNHPSGRLIQVIDSAAVGGVQQNFYRDNATVPESVDTGEAGSYGDAGIIIPGNIPKTFTLKSGLFVLSPGSAIVGSTYENYFFNPLVVTARPTIAPPGGSLYLPVVRKNG